MSVMDAMLISLFILSFYVLLKLGVRLLHISIYMLVRKQRKVTGSCSKKMSYEKIPEDNKQKKASFTFLQAG